MGVAALAMGIALAAGCTPPPAAEAPRAEQAAADTLQGWLQLVWGGPDGVSYLLTDGAGRTTPLQISDSLAAAADVRALDRRRVRVVAGRPATAGGAVPVRQIAPADEPPR